MKKAESPSLLQLFIGLIKNNFTGFIVFIAIWLLLSLIFPDYIIPDPWQVISKAGKLIDADFLHHLQLTMFRLLTGFVIAFLVASALGIIAYIMSVFEYAENILSLFQVIPGTILAIIFLIIFGVGDKVPIAMIIAMSIPIMAINTSTGLRGVNREQQEVVYVFGGSMPQVIRYVYIPALIPVFRSNFLIGTGLALKVIVLGEYIGCEDGIGFLLNNARILFQMEKVFFYLLIIMLIALIFHIIINLVFVELFRRYID
ncbi:MAG: ABC transporter permease subunit [Candidatus Stygibacter australis]|nr:ABC transporter permease subunit [Candidatus Stygibacter australis]MDP8323398.1 ABC transporter permease subunit [Candidatus Stygibacter australis]